ncbi:MAG: class I SAM-dependent methyltransferase [Chloroflexia bacterium]
MDHPDHLALIRNGIPAPGGIWADFGSGRGAFTLALADLLGPAASIWSVDRDARALRDQQATFRARFPATQLHPLVADFSRPLDLPPLDGALLANSLHFLRDAEKDTALGLIRGYLRPGGHLIIVEYNTDRGNPWVPHPFSYPTWQTIAHRNGLTATRLLAERHSRSSDIYAALSLRPPATTSPPRKEKAAG